MADSSTATGSRDDLTVEASRCLRVRFSESSCRRCSDSCPRGAVAFDGSMAINPEQCTGCLLCTAACPAGALEQNADFSACLAQLSRVPDPVLGCIRTKENANATLACLGGLSEEHLLSLCHSLEGKLVLNLSLCGDCPNNPMVSQLGQRLAALSDAGLSHGNCRIDLVESAKDIRHRDESVDRRSFFKFFGKALFKSADIITSTTSGQPWIRTEYAVKRVPFRRELLNRTRNKFSQELEIHARKHFDSCVSCDESCSRCQGCVAICPTGALQTGVADEQPSFDQQRCTGCGLCREFCLDRAVRISAIWK